jgi:hypothetical protein
MRVNKSNAKKTSKTKENEEKDECLDFLFTCVKQTEKCNITNGNLT